MKQYCLRLYRQMVADLAICNNESFCFTRQIESRFQLAAAYWSRIKQRLEWYEFKNDKSEIDFFRNIKPLFTSQLEYYCLLYYSDLFQPDPSMKALDFWAGEYRRLEKFEEENREFIFCFRQNKCELIPYYFLRRYYCCRNVFVQKLYEIGTQAVTNGDHLMANLIALRQYRQYAETKLYCLL